MKSLLRVANESESQLYWCGASPSLEPTRRQIGSWWICGQIIIIGRWIVKQLYPRPWLVTLSSGRTNRIIECYVLLPALWQGGSDSRWWTRLQYLPIVNCRVNGSCPSSMKAAKGRIDSIEYYLGITPFSMFSILFHIEPFAAWLMKQSDIIPSWIPNIKCVHASACVLRF